MSGRGAGSDTGPPPVRACAGDWRAAGRLGFSYEGTFYQHSAPKGRNRDTAWFSILDYEWPGIRRNFESWLAEDNFDGSGRQRQSLGSLNRSIA